MQNATNNNLFNNDYLSDDISSNKTLLIIIIMICILGVGLIILFTLKFRRYKYYPNRQIIVKVKTIRIKKDINQHQQIIEEVTNPDKEASKFDIIENDANNNKPMIITINNIDSNNSSINEKITSKIEEHKTNEEIDNHEKMINIKTTEDKINQDVLDVYNFLQEKGFSILEEK